MSDITVSTNEKIMIVGVNNMGKSVLFKHLVKQFLKEGSKVILYDSEKEYSDFQHPNLVVYQPEMPSDIPEFEEICRRTWEKGNMILAIESVDFYAPPQQPLSPYFKRCIHWGRNRGIGVLMTSRRIASVHKDACGLCRHWFLFHCYLPNDIKYIKQFIGEIAEDLAHLEPYYFIHWSGGKAEKCNPIPYEEA